jgi:hypothetical protein
MRTLAVIPARCISIALDEIPLPPATDDAVPARGLSLGRVERSAPCLRSAHTRVDK